MNHLLELSDEKIAVSALSRAHDFGQLVERYQEKFGRYIRRLGVQGKEDVEDLLQNSFISIYKNLNSFNPSLSFSSWAYRITHNEVMSFFRKKRARPEGYYVADSETAINNLKNEISLEHQVEVSISNEKISKALGKLDQKYRDVIVLRYFEEREYGEISDILKIPPGSVATLLHRAKKKLKKEFVG